MQTSKSERETAEVRAYFERLKGSQSAGRGQVLVEARDPHFVTAIDGAAARILQASSFRMCGRRAKGLATATEEQKRLADALQNANTHYGCVYLSITSPSGGRVQVIVQQCKRTTNQIRVSLVPAKTSHPLLKDKPLVDRRNEPGSESPDMLLGNLSFDELDIQIGMLDLEDSTNGLEGIMQAGLGSGNCHPKNRTGCDDPDHDPLSGDPRAALSN